MKYSILRALPLAFLVAGNMGFTTVSLSHLREGIFPLRENKMMSPNN